MESGRSSGGRAFGRDVCCLPTVALPTRILQNVVQCIEDVMEMNSTMMPLLGALFSFSGQNERRSVVTRRACIVTAAFTLWYLDASTKWKVLRRCDSRWRGRDGKFCPCRLRRSSFEAYPFSFWYADVDSSFGGVIREDRCRRHRIQQAST